LPINEPWGGDPIVAQRSQEGQRLPVAMRHVGLDPLPSRRPSPQRRHVGFSPSLVDEDQPGRIDPAAVFAPLRAPADDVGASLFGGNQRLFL
jgi:hypothetical protein